VPGSLSIFAAVDYSFQVRLELFYIYPRWPLVKY
jgi:hypothetical protein